MAGSQKPTGDKRQMSPWGSLGCLLRMAGSQHLLTQGPELETCTLRPCMVLLDCLTTITLLESKAHRRELEWEVPQWATKRVLVCFPSNGWKPTPTDKRQVNTYGNLACLRGMAGSEHKKATSYSISGEQKQNHRMFMLNGWKPKANRRQATDEHVRKA